jgi:hypothetical protein
MPFSLKSPCALAHAAGNDDMGAHFVKPRGQHAGLMGRGRVHGFALDLPVFRFNQCKLVTVAEVGAELPSATGTAKMILSMFDSS